MPTVGRSGSNGKRRNRRAFGLTDLVGPVTTLAVVLLAFIVVEAIGSYGRARDHVNAEARSVDALGEAGGRVKNQATGIELQGDYICYARAVRFKEWKTMGSSGDRAPEVGVWTGRVGRIYAAMRRAGGDAELDRMIELDTTRANERLSRITESSPTIPRGLYWLMFISVVISVLGLALFVSPKGNRVVYVGVLLVLAVLLGGTLWTINDLDSPFTGLNKIHPTEMARIQTSLEEDLATEAPNARIPCDAQGVAT